MSLEIEVTADDFGLTQSITDSILESVDAGSVSQVSVIPNGYDVPRALTEWKKRSKHLKLAIHINLTEGVALSEPSSIPNLVNAVGVFRHSPFSLLFATLVTPSFISDIRKEVGAQIAYIKRYADYETIAINGHQHVHVIPMVFRTIAELQKRENFRMVRIPQETLSCSKEIKSAWFGIGVIRYIGLSILSFLVRPIAKRVALPAYDFVVGVFLSGRLTYNAVSSSLYETQRHNPHAIELIVHPGSAEKDELDTWEGDTAWHYSRWRKSEQALVVSKEFETMLAIFSKRFETSRGSRTLELIRFFIAGGISSGVNLALLYIFTDIVGVWYLLSAFFATSISICISFVLQKFWTFSQKGHTNTVREISLYVINTVFGIVVSLFALHVLVESFHVWYMTAQLAVTVVIAAWNFLMYRFIIFPLTQK